MNRIVHCKSGEPFDVYVGRPSKFGNPFTHKPNTTAEFLVSSQEEAVLRFDEWIRTQPELLEAVKRELRGKVLACWCGPRDACHAQILATIANEE
jgi:hypothetical protein